MFIRKLYTIYTIIVKEKNSPPGPAPLQVRHAACRVTLWELPAPPAGQCSVAGNSGLIGLGSPGTTLGSSLGNRSNGSPAASSGNSGGSSADAWLSGPGGPAACRSGQQSGACRMPGTWRQRLRRGRLRPCRPWFSGNDPRLIARESFQRIACGLLGGFRRLLRRCPAWRTGRSRGMPIGQPSGHCRMPGTVQ